ncbi:MAG: thioredoxin domain-containing protein, partial [Planctomycetota bacterium]|nr:thioredoxin domain-containing protein [Planctomycetota bacterium]
MYKFRSHFICSTIFVLFVAIPANGQQTDITQSGNPQTVDDSKKEPEASSSAIDTSGEKDSESTKRSNRLASESSPYLLQHAMNPVDWYPWGQEAFDKAERENKLVFLSVGYAACHWCHVMERESFEDDEIAKILNERFVCVKVDREERPDVDQIYMTAVQLVTGSGGWPMSVFVLPDGKPFWGGTYFPARDGDRGSATGFLTVLSQIDLAWKEQNEQVRAQAQAVTEAIRAQQVSSENVADAKVYDREMIQQTLRSLQDQYDPIYGGFASGPNQPKFPEPSNLRFLMSLAMSEKSK